MKKRISPTRVIVLILVLGFLFVAATIFAIAFGEWTFAAAWALVSGWVTYPIRVIPQISYNPEMILCGLGAFGMAVYLSHKLLKWLAENLSPFPSPWPFRLTACLSLLLLSMFGTSIAMTGIIHQSAWLARSDSITKSRNSALLAVQKRDAQELAMDLLWGALENPQRKYPDSLVEFLRENKEEIMSDSILCHFDKGGDAPWLYSAASKPLGSRLAVIISPRPNHQNLIIVAYSDSSVEAHPFDELPPDIAVYFE